MIHSRKYNGLTHTLLPYYTTSHYKKEYHRYIIHHANAYISKYEIALAAATQHSLIHLHTVSNTHTHTGR